MRSYVRSFVPVPEHEAAIHAAQYYGHPHSIAHNVFNPVQVAYNTETRRYSDSTFPGDHSNVSGGTRRWL